MADRILGRLSFAAAAVTVLAAPWFFAAWEMIWFWPFAVGVFAAAALFGARLLAGGPRGDVARTSPGPIAWCAASYGLFLAYSAVRAFQTPVAMDAERAFLLLFTPFLLALVIVFGMTAGLRRALLVLLAADFVALGAYGIVNHILTGSEKVLWMSGFKYVGRASGSYYCPDHFAGAMELGAALALGLLLSRGVRWPARAGAAALLGVAVVGVVLSKSRGGGLTLAGMAGCAVLWGAAEWRPLARWALRGATVAGLALALAAVIVLAPSYRDRFTRADELRNIEAYCRYQMDAAALRAWRTSPVWGIGPGMHQNLWSHFAASPDGDREQRRWPKYTNHEYHSYEVHCDWIQLLEESGVVGMLLFLFAAGTVTVQLFRARGRGVATVRAGGPPPRENWAILSAIFGIAAMAMHSWVDFNLQMPATVWMLAVMVAVPLGNILHGAAPHSNEPAALS